MPKKNPNATSLANSPGPSHQVVDIEFALPDGQVVTEKVHWFIPRPGDTVSLGSFGDFIAIRLRLQYGDDSNEPWAKVTVRPINTATTGGTP